MTITPDEQALKSAMDAVAFIAALGDFDLEITSDGKALLSNEMTAVLLSAIRESNDCLKFMGMRSKLSVDSEGIPAVNLEKVVNV